MRWFKVGLAPFTENPEDDMVLAIVPATREEAACAIVADRLHECLDDLEALLLRKEVDEAWAERIAYREQCCFYSEAWVREYYHDLLSPPAKNKRGQTHK